MARPTSPGQLPVQEDRLVRREREVREVLIALRGPAARRLVRELAEAATRGEGVRLDDALKARYGKPTGAPFGGIVGAANKISRRIAGRDLIARDAALGGYRLDPLDAEIVLAAWPPQERRPVSTDRRSGP